ncbi:MAG: hypothetical protein Fur0023_16240 [Bacteroidia bacterium]
MYQTYAQKYGMNCQYFPGLQIGSVKVSTNHPKIGSYSYSAGLPILMLDRIAKWYFNLNMNATYYAATQTNKANDNKLPISKAEGGYFSGRIGYMFGKNPGKLKVGINFNLGWETSNLDSITRPFKQRGYTGMGGGLIFYKGFGKIGLSVKAGYEKYSSKKFIESAHGFYFESAIGYNFYQKFGVSVMPCFYSKDFTYKALTDNAITQASVSSFVIRIGITKFF